MGEVCLGGERMTNKLYKINENNGEERSRLYLNAGQLSELTPWSVPAIDSMCRTGVLKLNVHYFRPHGPRSHRIFFWPAIVELIEGQSAAKVTDRVTEQKAQIPRPPTMVIDVEQAQTELLRLLS